MILTALARYYNRLATETDSAGNPKVPPYGFSEEKIGYILVLSKEGDLVDVIPHLSSDKKPQPKLMSVPRPAKRTSGVKPNFLWDKSAYVLGVEGNKDKQAAKETPFMPSEKTFAAFKEHHLDCLKDSDDEGLQALRLFLEKWQPENFSQPPCSNDLIDANLVFKLDGKHGYLHQSEAAQALWTAQLIDENAEQGLCLVSGKQAPLARLHPAIKGVFGGQSSGGSIISFNKESFASFGKEQGANAPVSEASAFAYTTALNYLLRRDNGHCLTIGDASTVFWAEAADKQSAVAAEGFFASVLTPPDDEQESQKIFDVLVQVAKGRPLQEIAPELAADTRFYVLGLAPNAARISVRFWYESTLGELAKNISVYWQDLHIEPCGWKGKAPSVWRILMETTPKRKGADGRLKKSESKDIPPQLAGEYMRSILTGRKYPQTMLARMIGRIRSDGYITGLRVAVIKAVLNRNNLHYREISMEESKLKTEIELPVGLNKSETDIPYRLGRLFAVLEIAQASALGNLNATVRDKFYGSASTSPQYVFPRLLDNYNNHIAVLRKGRGAEWVKKPKSTALWLEREVGEIMQEFFSGHPFPRHLSLEEQGRFVVGYYHQRYTKHVEAPEDVNTALDHENNVEENEESQGE
ncbi:type I-C CRISPR-associated protein Cas8c/Csd1 [Testudinibacter sp. TR-2022]|uniref:type I-C CRISPR-associated protein Cas8c/Csd1 n=1 Tax=Testudinibacter sp. TR-2022 TaxID=2585029 RepID=UPI00111A7F64|nr:type I-C CRISPR-associated protein Cas8c/Csd1 [Testudinibacter sp. TR-2022]TNH07689.1 type I-C CRISPR-associated protein Cas8c/Csd1 [Pasteurellaceae bacterium Phil11]TNH23078.1 type I-C CRISPR-associated protein Cas8c/Csd1 [Testudinibacter sp. TR-2022]TNH25227.1 type I-C CRISPR-associated protein Cas8c/Csd1 [Testudinibacter sp. TR-2022]